VEQDQTNMIGRRQSGVRRAAATALAGACLFASVLAPTARAAPVPRAWSLEGREVFVRMPSLDTEAVMAIAQDGQGFLWFGTQSNLLRWDGYRLRTYARSPEAAGSLPDNFIRSLLVDERGRLWVGTNAGGLSRYDPQADGFVSLPIGAGGTSDGMVAALHSDGHGGLWIGTGHGVDHLDGATQKVDAPSGRGATAPIGSLLQDRDGVLWAGSRKGLLRRGPGDAEFQAVALPVPDGSTPSIRVLHQDRAGRIWVGTDHFGVFILDEAGTAPRRLLEAPGRPLNEGISALSEVGGGEVWLGTAENGLLRVDTATWIVQREQRDAARAHSLPSNQIDALFLDSKGTLWIGTRAALASVTPRQHLVQTYYGGSNPGLLIEDETISALLALPDGRVWLALRGGGVEIVDPVEGRVGRLRAEPERPDRGLPRNEIITMARAPDGSIFLGTDVGLYRASADGRAIERLQVPLREKVYDVRSLLVRDGRLWVGGLDGLDELDVRPGGALAPRRHWDQELGDTRVRTLVDGGDGAVWIGTPAGVARIDGGSGAVQRLPVDARSPEKLPGGYVSSMLTDAKGRLWVATFGRGIQVEQGRDPDGRPVFRRLTQADGLPQNSVDALLRDAAGNIWASTDGGLARVDPANLSIRAFRAAEGVGIDGFFTGEAVSTAAGDLLFGGLNGFVVVHPERLGKGDGAAALVLTDVQVGGQAVAPSPALLHDGLQVGPSDRSLAVEFAALDFVGPDQRRFGYRLEGFDSEWQETPTTRRLAAYTNLPPGDYRLALRSAVGGEWSEALRVPVHVRAAWYETASVRALGAVGALAVVIGLVQLRTLVLRRRQAELERLVAERTAQLQRSQEYLERMAYFDVLTALPNRRMFNDHLRRLIAACQRGHGEFALLLIDLDDFKSINDTFGHDVGDAVLAEIGSRLKGLIRETDLAARLGGDEFGLLLANPRGKDDVDAACGRIVRKVCEPIGVSGHFVVIGASVGIAGLHEVGATPEELYKAADVALYEAKRSGRNTWRWDRRSAATAAVVPARRQTDVPATN
jgi:diguanylate cyclase (GGDEF)-like protein